MKLIFFVKIFVLCLELNVEWGFFVNTKDLQFYEKAVNPIQYGPFWGLLTDVGGGRKGRCPPLSPEICLTYTEMMKLGTVIPYIRKIQNSYKLLDTHWVLLRLTFFSLQISNFCYVKNPHIDWILIHISNSFNFFELLKVVLRNVLGILMMPAQLATLGVLKIKVFWNKGYDIIISAHYITSKILFSDSNYIFFHVNKVC